MEVMDYSFIARFFIVYGTLRSDYTVSGKKADLLKKANIPYKSLGKYKLDGISLRVHDKSPYPIASINKNSSAVVELIDIMPKGVHNTKDLQTLYQRNLSLDSYENCPLLYKACRLHCSIDNVMYTDCKIYIAQHVGLEWKQVYNFIPTKTLFKKLKNESNF